MQTLQQATAMSIPAGRAQAHAWSPMFAWYLQTPQQGVKPWMTPL